MLEKCEIEKSVWAWEWMRENCESKIQKGEVKKGLCKNVYMLLWWILHSSGIFGWFAFNLAGTVWKWKTEEAAPQSSPMYILLLDSNVATALTPTNFKTKATAAAAQRRHVPRKKENKQNISDIGAISFDELVFPPSGDWLMSNRLLIWHLQH